MSDQAEEAALMRKVAEGSEAAFRVLADRHLPRMLRLARKTLNGADDAEDVAQEALVRLWRQAGEWREGRGSVATWLYTVVYRLCVDRLRRRPGLDLDVAQDVEDPHPSAFELMAQDDDLDALARAMAALQPRQRAAVTLFYYDELSGEAAAKVLGLSLRAFWSLLHRARQAMQAEMRPITALMKGSRS